MKYEYCVYLLLSSRSPRSIEYPDVPGKDASSHAIVDLYVRHLLCSFFFSGTSRTTLDVRSVSVESTTAVNNDDTLDDVLEQCLNSENHHTSGHDKVRILEQMVCNGRAHHLNHIYLVITAFDDTRLI